MPEPVLVSLPIPVIPSETLVLKPFVLKVPSAAIESDRSRVGEVERRSELERTTIESNSSRSGTQVVIGAPLSTPAEIVVPPL